jgi:hypothetical protein
MNKVMSLAAILVVACSMSAMAQTGSDAGMKKMSMSGCIAEKDGHMMMMNKMHPEGVMLMGSQDMKPHVGHMMKVTGMMGPDSKDSKMMDMKVTSMKMMADHCDASAQ